MLVCPCDSWNEIQDCAQPTTEDKKYDMCCYCWNSQPKDWQEKDGPKNLARVSPGLRPTSRTRPMSPISRPFPEHLQPSMTAESR